MSLSKIRQVLESNLPAYLIQELLDSYQLQKDNFFLGKHRITEVEGGRFSEAAFRMLQYLAGMSVTPIGTQLNSERLINHLQNAVDQVDSVRFHIPRTLRVIYDIRNKRDAAHLNDQIDPNLQDSTFVFAALDWVLAEFIRLSSGINPEEAYALVKAITVHSIPAVEDFDGFLKTLKPQYGPSERVLVLLYHRNSLGANTNELSNWLKPSQKRNLKRTLNQLEYDKDLIHSTSGVYKITRLGIIEVQKKKLLDSV